MDLPSGDLYSPGTVIVIGRVHLLAQGMAHDRCRTRLLVLFDSIGGLLIGCYINQYVHLR